MRILSYYRFGYIVISKSETGIYKLLVQNHCITYKTRLSLRGRRLKEKGMRVLGAREKRGARAPRFALTPETPFPFPFKRLPSRLDAPMLSQLNLQFFVQLVDACGYVTVKLFRLFLSLRY